jgi:hypothetical protein
MSRFVAVQPKERKGVFSQIDIIARFVCGLGGHMFFLPIPECMGSRPTDLLGRRYFGWLLIGSASLVVEKFPKQRLSLDGSLQGAEVDLGSFQGKGSRFLAKEARWL